MNSEQRAVLITGSTRGIGRASAELLAQRGWRVGINGRNPEAVEHVVRDIGESAVPVAFDATDEDAMLAGFGAFKREVGAVQAVVHCVGTMRDAPLGMLTKALIEEQLASNVVSSLMAVQIASRVLRRGGASIVLVGSVVGEDGAVGQTLYGATKAAVGGIVRSAAKELGPRGIRVNGVVPGIIATDLTAGLTQEARESLARAASLRRNGLPEEVASVVAFLVSDDANFMSGELVRVTGGLTLP
jgi:3-oxoacyl-[acyl-carrier protein] reductase